jgi:hypothetical protein
MKHIIQMTVEDAKDLARNLYKVDNDVAVEITDLPASPAPGDFTFHFNKNIAASNKIALIKFMRQVIDDSRRGVSGADGSLSGAKAYVEKYFGI